MTRGANFRGEAPGGAGVALLCGGGAGVVGAGGRAAGRLGEWGVGRAGCRHGEADVGGSGARRLIGCRGALDAAADGGEVLHGDRVDFDGGGGGGLLDCGAGGVAGAPGHVIAGDAEPPWPGAEVGGEEAGEVAGPDVREGHCGEFWQGAAGDEAGEPGPSGFGVFAVRAGEQQLGAVGLVKGQVRGPLLDQGLVHRDGGVAGIAGVGRARVLELGVRLVQVGVTPAALKHIALDYGGWELPLPGWYVGG